MSLLGSRPPPILNTGQEYLTIHCKCWTDDAWRRVDEDAVYTKERGSFPRSKTLEECASFHIKINFFFIFLFSNDSLI